jgi:RNA-directed DNA polymerase
LGIPLSKLQELKSVATREDFARLLGYQPKFFAFVLYKQPKGTKYQEFEIPKRSGGVRKISAPEPRLKLLQRRFADLLYECQTEIEKKRVGQRSLSHGFKRDHSIISNARPHKNRRYVLNIDIRDFFPSITFPRVRGFFLKSRDFELSEKAATVAAQIACSDNGLPQGSPCSPIISELVGHMLDVRLVRLAKLNRCTYSRYADDMTFSTSQKRFPPALAFQDAEDASKWILGAPLQDEVARARFVINEDKTRMQCRPSRQLVTGLTVNKKVNIRADYYRRARSMCNAVFRTGAYFRPSARDKEAGNDPETITSLMELEGILNHTHYVRDQMDLRSSGEKKKEPTATRTLYRRFLFFKHFMTLKKPLVLCEGKTDSVYLKCAIRSLPEFQPRLAVSEGNATTFNIQFFNCDGIAAEIMQLNGGTGEFKHFFQTYGEMAPTFRFAPMSHPVIALIDNDEGAYPVFSILKEIYKTPISHLSTAPFYRICHNLYLIKTPETGGDGMSFIEELFDQAVREFPLEGKSFNPYKEHKSENEYGKAIFADRVVRSNRHNINFERFTPLLQRIVSVLEDYKPIAV